MQTQLTLNLGIEEKVDVRSLIVHGDIERETHKAKREQPAPEFERVLMDGADCAFRRRCGSRSQLLVLLVTQGQYYVTDERTGSRHALTTARLGTFCKGATGTPSRRHGAASRCRATTPRGAPPWSPCSTAATSARCASATWCAWSRGRRAAWEPTPSGTSAARGSTQASSGGSWSLPWGTTAAARR